MKGRQQSAVVVRPRWWMLMELEDALDGALEALDCEGEPPSMVAEGRFPDGGPAVLG